MQVTNQDLIVLNGGGLTPTTGHRSHCPVWADAHGVEYISLDGESFTPLASLTSLKIIKREIVVRR